MLRGNVIRFDWFCVCVLVFFFFLSNKLRNIQHVKFKIMTFHSLWVAETFYVQHFTTTHDKCIYSCLHLIFIFFSPLLEFCNFLSLLLCFYFLSLCRHHTQNCYCFVWFRCDVFFVWKLFCLFFLLFIFNENK